MIDFIRNELILSQQWMSKIIHDVDEDLWKMSPSGFKTNLNWQVGHVLISTYFHSIICIAGSDSIVKESLNPKEYSTWYGMNSNPLHELDVKPEKSVLLEHLSIIDKRSLEILDNLKEENLAEDTLMRNPVAKTKQEALIWAFKHRMWHSGQMALIKSHL